MDILIIGNGFDLAHNLQTSYKNFLDYNIQNKSTDKSCKKLCETNLWMKHFITKQNELADTWIDLENEIYSVIYKLKEIPAIRNSGFVPQLCPQILTLQEKVNSFSFDSIETYLKKPNDDYDTKNQEYLTDILDSSTGMFCVYIKTPKGFINFLYDQLREFTKAFEEYLIKKIISKENNISKFTLQLNSDKNQPQGNILEVLSFNYTDTCERLYNQKRGYIYGYKIRTYYIHGQANLDNICDLVLGTQSFDNKRTSDNLKPIPVDFNVFKKHNQRHKFGTIEAYQDLLKIINNSLQTPLVFHVIGHSLDKTDHKVLKHIFLANTNAKINIYYHNEEAQERMINNITEIIGEEEVMTRVRFIFQHDPSRGILIHNTK